MGNPYSDSGPMSTIGWINTNDLNLGNHTAQMFFEYEFTYQGVQYGGHFKSKKFHFRIVEDNQDNILKAKDSPELEAKVKASFHTAETEKELIPQLPPGPSRARNLSDEPNGTKPQTSSYERTTGLRTTAHCPYWRIAPALPVDMVFYVIIQDLTTGRNFRGNDIGVPKGAKGLGIFVPFKLEEFADGRTGTIPVKITLKPSRSLAQSIGWTTQYYPRKLTIEGLTIQVVSTYSKRTEFPLTP